MVLKLIQLGLLCFYHREILNTKIYHNLNLGLNTKAFSNIKLNVFQWLK